MKKAFVIIPYILAITALIIGAFYDYQITDALYKTIPYIGIFFEKIFLIPIQFVVVFTMCLLYRDRHKVFYLVLAEAAMFYVTLDSVMRWYKNDHILYYLVLFMLSLLIVIITNVCIRRISEQKVHQILPFFIYMSVVLITAVTITTIIKVFWGRIRYRDLDQMTQYCVWYKPCGVMGNHSFPSGHVTAATALLCLFQWRKNPYEHIQLWRYVLIITFIVLMIIARMVMGAHFLSDTAMGFTITYTCYLLYTKWFKRRNYL